MGLIKNQRSTVLFMILAMFQLSEIATGQVPTEDEVKRSADELKRLLMAPVASGDSQFFFNDSGDDIDKAAFFERIILNDPDLNDFSNLGREFKRFYFTQLNADFSEPQVPFMVHPERATLRWLTRKNRKAAFRPPPDYQASLSAWEQTVSEYNLPPSLSLNDLEQLRNENENEGIYQRYLSTYRKNLYQDSIQRAPQFSVIDLKNKLIQKIRALRIQNFKAAVMRADQIKVSLTFLMLSKVNRKDVLMVSAKDLALSDIVFESHRAHLASHKLQIKNNRFVRFLVDNLQASYWRDHALARQMYRIKWHFPISPDALVHVRLKSSPLTEITISEEDFNFLLHSVNNQVENLQSKDLWARRYLLEAARRDTMLSDFFLFVRDRDDTDIDQFKKRLEKRLLTYENHYSTEPCSLTEELRFIGADAPRVDSRINFLRWAGYSIHPDYWRVRDLAAHGVKNSLEKFWEKLSSKRRLRSPMARLATTTAFYLSLSAAVWLTSNTLSQQLNGSQSQPWDITADNLGSNQLREVYDPSRDDEILSSSRNQSSTESSFVITHVKIPRDQIPVYFNLISKSTFPPSVRNDPTGDDLRADGVEQLQLNSTPRENHFDVFSRIGTQTFHGRLPIISPAGYQVSSVMIIGHDGLPLSANDFKVYINKQNGLQYAQIRLISNEPYTYLASFSPLKIKRDDPQFQFDNTSREAIKIEAHKLASAGGFRLADNILSGLLRNQISNVSQLSDIFSQSSVYTTNTTNETVNKTTDRSTEQYGEYKTLLHQGTYYYDCKGAAGLFGDFGNAVYKTLNRREVRVYKVNGFVRRRNSLLLPMTGHRHNIVSRVTRDYNFIDIDATPADPKTDRNPKTLSQGGRRVVLDEKNRYKPDLEKKKQTLRNRIKKMALNEMVQDLAQENLAQLKELRKTTLDYLQQNNIKLGDFRSETGTLALSRIVLEFIEKKIILRDAVEKSLAISFNIMPFSRWNASDQERITQELNNKMETFGSPQAVFENLLKENHQRFKKAEAIENQRLEQGLPPLNPLIGDQEIHELLAALSLLLASHQWHPFGLQSNPPARASVCSKAL